MHLKLEDIGAYFSKGIYYKLEYSLLWSFSEVLLCNYITTSFWCLRKWK